MCFNQERDISTLNGGSLKLVDKLTYLGSSVSSTERDINMPHANALAAFDRLSIRKSNLSDKIKHNFFQAVFVSVLLYGCTTWTLTKRTEKNCTSMLWAILNKSWKQHPTKQQLYGYQPPIYKTIQIRRTPHAEHCWKSKNELISDILVRTPSHGRVQGLANQQELTYNSVRTKDEA